MSTTAAEVAPKRETQEPPVHHDSQEEEYESAEEIEGEYDEDDVEEIEIEEEVEEEEDEVDDDELEDEEDEEGAEQKLKEKPLDDDEDRKNPQFIPKKGYFYEHDDRTKIEEEAGAEEVGEEPKKEEKPKKAADSLEKWGHDKFDESEQAPKSREELTSSYGYDIRGEDQPPRARRRRRYGRGPTKYTRRWEEEEAYQKPRGGFRGGRGGGRGGGSSGRGGGGGGKDRNRRDSKDDQYEEEFPELGGGGGGGDSTSVSRSNLHQTQTTNKGQNSEITNKSISKPSSAASPPKQQQRERDSNREAHHQQQGERRVGGGGESRRGWETTESMYSRDNNSQRRPGRGGGGGRDQQDRDGENYSSSRGGRGGRGGGNNRRGGRRNEFTNRNRYPNRRDMRDDQDFNEYSNHANSNNGPSKYSSSRGGGVDRDDRGDGRNSNNTRGGGGNSYSNSYENSSRDRDYGGGNRSINKGETNNTVGGSRRVEQKEYRMIVNGTSGGGSGNNEAGSNKQRGSGYPSNQDRSAAPSHQHQNQPHQQHRIPPFTNTEYPAPGKYSGNTNANNSNNARSGPPPSSNRAQPSQQQQINERHHHQQQQQQQQQQHTYNNEQSDDSNVSMSGRPLEGTMPPQKEPVRDLREKLNQIRMQKGYQNQNVERRSQIPPRLQQQQQQQQQQVPPPQQQQQQQIDPGSNKPRRYSTQREQRQGVVQQAIVTSGGMVIPNAVAPSMAPQGVPANLLPVVTMAADGAVVPVPPSTVAAYQPANYYEGTQVYEASGSPVTGNGPSVSPSLWNPHANAYATAPYPSPPTAPQVPQPPYADPTAFIGPAGPAIYAAPPQFLQDPTIINYSGAAPPFPPPYHAHPQGFQGYAQVTPAPPPEVYHAGVTYYSTQNQIQRPPMMAPQKRPKSVLQLVEPPEKAKGVGGDKVSSQKEPPQQQVMEQHNQPPPQQPSTTELAGVNPIPENPSVEAELSKKLQETSLNELPRDTPSERKPSPLREFQEEPRSWAEEMELLNSPSYPDESRHFELQSNSREEGEAYKQGSTSSLSKDSSTTSTVTAPLQNTQDGFSANVDNNNSSSENPEKPSSAD